MTELILGGLFLCTLAMWAWREYRHDAERKDLYSRIQARDLTEYTSTAPGRPPPRHRNFIAASMRRNLERQQEAE